MTLFRPDYQSEGYQHEGLHINFNFQTQPTVIMFRAKLHSCKGLKLFGTFLLHVACGNMLYICVTLI